MRYLPHTPRDIRQMLDTIGVASIDDLFGSIPEKYRLQELLPLPEALTETDLMGHLKALAGANTTDMPVFLGAGAYAHHVPAAVDAVISRTEFYTSYTPYQPEISQGTLQAIFEYQTMAAQLMGTQIANASMYDGATAVMEAAIMARRRTRRQNILVSAGLHPHYLQVLHTYLGKEALTMVPLDADGSLDTGALQGLETKDVAALIVQTPNFFGVIEDVAAIRRALDEKVMVIGAFTEAMAFGLVTPPGTAGADIVAGEGQSMGLALGFGGPYLGMFGAKVQDAKYMPGRLVGQTLDDRGNQCYVMTLAAREQHIRRARASSNICTNVQLDALAAAVYMSLLGKTGYQKLAVYNHFMAMQLKDALVGLSGIKLHFADAPVFNEFVIDLPMDAEEVHNHLKKHGFIAGLPLGRYFPDMKNSLLLCATEMNSIDQINGLVSAVKAIL